MSNINHDPELPDDDFIEEEVAQAKPGMSPLKKMLIGSAAAIAVVGGLMISVGGGGDGESSMRRAPNLDATPGGANQETSELYRASLRSRNEQLADMARERGESFMATPEAILAPLDRLNAIDAVDIDAVAAAPVVEEAPLPPRERRILPRPTPVAAPAPMPEPEPEWQDEVEEVAVETGPAPENPYIARIGGMMQATAPAFAPRPMMSISLETASRNGQGEANAIVDSGPSAAVQPCENCNSGAGSSSDHNSSNLPMLRPGDVLYAETVNAVDSDTPSSVIAEVVTGPYKGARLVGSFQTDRNSGRMLVQFAAMTMHDGTTVPISGVAVDGRTAETTVRSDIERRYVKRYGPVLAASFIATYAQAIAQPEQRLVDTGSGTEIITEAPTDRQAIAAGVSAGLSTIARDVAEYAPKGPKVTLRDGWPIAVMILTPMQEAVQARAAVRASTPAGYYEGDLGDEHHLHDDGVLDALSHIRDH